MVRFADEVTQLLFDILHDLRDEVNLIVQVPVLRSIKQRATTIGRPLTRREIFVTLIYEVPNRHLIFRLLRELEKLRFHASVKLFTVDTLRGLALPKIGRVIQHKTARAKPVELRYVLITEDLDPRIYIESTTDTLRHILLKRAKL